MPWTDYSRKPPDDAPERRGPWDPPPDLPDEAAGRPRKPRPRPTSPHSAGEAAPPTVRPRAPHRPPKPVASRKHRASAPGPGLPPRLRTASERVRTALRSHPVLRLAAGRRLGAILAGALAVGLASGWLASGLYRVNAGELGVATRFGALSALTPAGLHYHLPRPFGDVRRIPFGSSQLLAIPADGSGEGEPLRVQPRGGPPLALGLTLRWRVVDPIRFAFHMADPSATLRLATEAAVAGEAGQVTAADLAEGRAAIAGRAAADLQRTLDGYGAGVDVEGLSLASIQPPPGAAQAYGRLVAAVKAAAAGRDQASAYRARVVAAARGDAARTLEAARAERDGEIAEAQGEAARFAAVDAAYRSAPAVTRDRLYTEAMSRLLHDIPKVLEPAGAGPVSPPPRARPSPGAGQAR